LARLLKPFHISQFEVEGVFIQSQRAQFAKFGNMQSFQVEKFQPLWLLFPFYRKMVLVHSEFSSWPHTQNR
jgi:hypothetical protein